MSRSAFSFSALSTPDCLAPRVVRPAPWLTRDWAILALLVLFAALLRLAFFNGFFGSDDLVYLTRSKEIAEGLWTRADYNGALRYGYNIPAAFFIYLLGLSPFSANAWTLFCSLAEIALVYFFAARYLGRNAAVFAALILASIPLHIALGTRIHADAVLACFLTLSFVLFYMAEQTASRGFYFATGLSLGMIFWTKELGVITLLAFATYPFFAGRADKAWLWVIGGGMVMLVSHLVLMQAIAGDPFHLITTVTGQVRNGVVQDGYEDAAGYYFSYLLVDIRHTWIAPFLAVLALVGLLTRSKHPADGGTVFYLGWWLLALLVVLSFTPVSFSPLRLTMKQSNYLNLFLAPIALLGGTMLARMHSASWRNGLLIITVAGGIALGAVAQHAYQVFTANSKAAIDFMKAHPDAWILGTVNNANMARVISTLEGNPLLAQQFGTLARASEFDASPASRRQPLGYAILDLETLNWGNTAFLSETPPACWQPVVRLTPQSRDPGYWLLRTALRFSPTLPDAMGQAVKPTLLRYLAPRPATIYRVDATNLWCKLPA